MQSQIFKSTPTLPTFSEGGVVNVNTKSSSDRLYIMLSRADIRPNNSTELIYKMIRTGLLSFKGDRIMKGGSNA